MKPVTSGPQRQVPVTSERDRFCAELFDSLWNRYRQRVSHVQIYEQLIAAAGAKFDNDHIAFRTFACQSPLTGIASISRLFEALGYRPAGVYQFEDKHLSAVHFQHPNHQFPKLFISELRTWELSSPGREIASRIVQAHRPEISTSVLAELATFRVSPASRAELLKLAVEQIHELPWEIPDRADVLTLNKQSQYAAWVAVHGYNVNHFTSLINSHGSPSLDNIEKTIAALKHAGVPMKSEIEGEPESKLRQTATEAVQIDVDVRDQGKPTRMPWSYAYFELAERGEIVDQQTGKRFRFEGFLGPQATNLFEMTKVR